MASVVLVDPENGGLDAMLAALLTSAIEKPEKAAVLDATSGTVTIVVPDAEVEVGLRFGNGVCQVYPSGIPGSKVRIEMSSDTLLGFSTIPLMAGMPSVLTPAGREFTKKVLTRQVKIGGIQHLKLVTQLNTLLSLA